MANEKQLQFDKNQFTQDILGAKSYYMSTRYRIFDGLLDTRTDTKKREEYAGAKNDEDLAKYISNVAQNDADINLEKYRYECYKNPDGEFAQKLRQYWNFAKYIFDDYNEGYTNNYLVIINGIGTFDEKTQLAVFRELFEKIKFGPDKAKMDQIITQIGTKIINNKFANMEDRVRATEYLLKTNHDVVRDTIEYLKTELDKELHADLPNSEKVQSICNNAKYILTGVRNLWQRSTEAKNIVNPIDAEYITTVEKEFDLNKILTSGTEYVAKTKETLEERMNMAEKQLKVKDEEINKKEQNIQYLNASINDAKSKLQNEKDKNAKLVEMMNEMQQQMDQQYEFVKALKMKMASLKMGMFGNGKEFQAWLNDKLANQL